MEAKEITISQPVTLPGYTLFAIIETSVVCEKFRRGIALNWIRQPLAVIITTQNSARALSICGEEVALSELMLKAPQIGKLLPAEK
jgi:hypothetical protein